VRIIGQTAACFIPEVVKAMQILKQEGPLSTPMAFVLQPIIAKAMAYCVKATPCGVEKII
jgi:hypothetical protein